MLLHSWVTQNLVVRLAEMNGMVEQQLIMFLQEQWRHTEAVDRSGIVLKCAGELIGPLAFL